MLVNGGGGVGDTFAGERILKIRNLGLETGFFEGGYYVSTSKDIVSNVSFSNGFETTNGNDGSPNMTFRLAMFYSLWICKI